MADSKYPVLILAVLMMTAGASANSFTDGFLKGVGNGLQAANPIFLTGDALELSGDQKSATATARAVMNSLSGGNPTAASTVSDLSSGAIKVSNSTDGKVADSIIAYRNHDGSRSSVYFFFGGSTSIAETVKNTDSDTFDLNLERVTSSSPGSSVTWSATHLPDVGPSNAVALRVDRFENNNAKVGWYTLESVSNSTITTHTISGVSFKVLDYPGAGSDVQQVLENRGQNAALRLMLPLDSVSKEESAALAAVPERYGKDYGTVKLAKDIILETRGNAVRNGWNEETASTFNAWADGAASATSDSSTTMADLDGPEAEGNMFVSPQGTVLEGSGTIYEATPNRDPLPDDISGYSNIDSGDDCYGSNYRPPQYRLFVPSGLDVPVPTVGGSTSENEDLALIYANYEPYSCPSGVGSAVTSSGIKSKDINSYKSFCPYLLDNSQCKTHVRVMCQELPFSCSFSGLSTSGSGSGGDGSGGGSDTDGGDSNTGSGDVGSVDSRPRWVSYCMNRGLTEKFKQSKVKACVKPCYGPDNISDTAPGSNMNCTTLVSSACSEDPVRDYVPETNKCKSSGNAAGSGGGGGTAGSTRPCVTYTNPDNCPTDRCKVNSNNQCVSSTSSSGTGNQACSSYSKSNCPADRCTTHGGSCVRTCASYRGNADSCPTSRCTIKRGYCVNPSSVNN